MASQVPGFATSFTELAMALLSASEVVPRARLIAQQITELAPGSGVVVYILDRSGDPVWVPKATAGEVAFEQAEIAFDSGTLGALGERQEPVIFSGARLRREQYGHLNVRRTVASLVGLPMLAGEEMVGAIEVLSFDSPLEESQLGPLTEVARLGGLGLAAGSAYESERNTSLESITRLTQLYDLERSFNSTLEMDNLLPLVASKYHELLKVQAVNLWLVEGNDVRLMTRAGIDPTVALDTVQGVGQGLTGDVADSGEPVIVHADADERLQKRNAGSEDGAIFSLMGAPLLHEGAEVGWVECVNKLDGTPFDEDDLFFLTTLNVTASSALHNASLLLAERKVQIMETLVQVSQEITSTLNLERVLETIVTAPQAVIAYERSAIGLESGGRLKLSAVTGVAQNKLDDPQLQPLKDILQWASSTQEELYVRKHGDDIDASREETRAKFRAYFETTGMRGFYSAPLSDDTGRVGILSLESSDPDFLNPAHLEIIKVLSSQATVALRNAQMYKEVPFISVLEPVLEKKRKFLALEKRRRQATIVLAVAAALFLVLCPLPMRVDGSAVVAPAHTAQVMSEVEGVVKAVYVRESDHVHAGQVLADLEAWNYQAELAAARAKYETALSEMNRALVGNDGTEAGIRRVQADYWAAEVKRSQERLEKTRLRSPIEGVVATPHLENSVGKHLAAGETFAEVMDSSQASVDVAVDETEVPLLKAGERAAIKLEGFPTRTFRGKVAVVSPKASVLDERRVFFARVAVPNNDSVIRAGMQGRGKVSTGWHPAGYVFLRGPALWLYSKVWSWFGW